MANQIAQGYENEFAIDYSQPVEEFGLIRNWSAYGVACFLLSLTMYVMVLKFIDSAYVSGVVVMAGLAFLMFTTRATTFLSDFLQQPHGLLMLVGLILVTVSAGIALEISSLVKAFLLILMMVFVGSRMPSLHRGELLCGFMIFAVIELGLVFATRSEWNPNAYCNHISFACLCGAAGFFGTADTRYRVAGWALLVLCFGALVLTGSRTATLAFVVPNVLYLLLLSGRFTVGVVRFFLVLFAVFAITFFGDISGGVSDLALKNLDNDSAIARFFLYDKTEKKIETDMLDRRDLWEVSFEVMMDNPIVGIGYDRPLPKTAVLNSARDQRAHNSYLEIGYQCGIVAMVVWALFYFLMLDFMTALIRDYGRDPIVYLAFTSTCYLVLAGMMESSGILSLAVPGNWVSLSCFFFLAAGWKMMQSNQGYPQEYWPVQ